MTSPGFTHLECLTHAALVAYDLNSAAAAAGVHKRTVDPAIARGDFAVRYPSSKPIILHTELLAWAESLRVNK